MLWSILIGIDYYTRHECLQGAVHDVRACEDHLKATFEDFERDITILTATTPSDVASLTPREHPDKWPTWNNIDKALLRITAEAKKGDSVFIHYSGHGTSEPSANNQRQTSSALALALTDGMISTQGKMCNGGETPGYELLYGQTLAYRLKELGDMGLPVTLVLDCCFSGNVIRTESGVRWIEYNPSARVVGQDADGPKLSSSSQDGALRHQWLLNPENYTILAACGP